jgi:nucleoid-associated protein YgaU
VLDASIPADVATSVRNALKSATDPNQLRGFANALATTYPKAAELLNARADALAPAPAPQGVVLASTGPVQPTAPVPSASYKVKPGDSPSKIAAAIVHDGNRWKELVAANPQKKRAANGNFASLVPGEVLQLPPSWGPPAAPAKSQPAPQGGA